MPLHHQNNGSGSRKFYTLVFTVAGGMGGKVRALQLRLATLLSLMKRIDEPKVTSWIGSKVNFALLRSMLSCLQGS